MTHSTRLMIPLGLALGAAAINFVAMKNMTRPVEFVKVTRALKAGERFASENLAKLPLPAEFARLEDTAVPYKHVGILYGQPAPRDFRENDIVFLRDGPEGGLQFHVAEDDQIVPVSLERVEVVVPLLRVGSKVSFRFKEIGDKAKAEWVGPFPIVSVGNRLGDQAGDSTESEKPKTISIAIKKPSPSKPHEQDEKFQRYYDLQGLDQAKLLGIQHHLPTPSAP